MHKVSKKKYLVCWLPFSLKLFQIDQGSRTCNITKKCNQKSVSRSWPQYFNIYILWYTILLSFYWLQIKDFTHFLCTIWYFHSTGFASTFIVFLLVQEYNSCHMKFIWQGIYNITILKSFTNLRMCKLSSTMK